MSIPSTRGTLDLHWRCLSVSLLCTYSVLHLKLPNQSTPRTEKQQYTWLFLLSLNKVGWMLLTCIAPEPPPRPFAKAWRDQQSARIAQSKLEKQA